MKKLLLLGAIILAPLALANAGSPDSTALCPGAKVRLWKNYRRYQGILLALSADSIVIQNTTQLAFRVGDIYAVKQIKGRRRHELTGLLVGCAASIIAVPIAVKATTRGADDDLSDIGTNISSGIGVGVGTFVGCAFLGTVVGAMIETDRWVKVRPWPPPR